ncbi:DUF3710 domain-containing protein [Phaeacidiphilus oryzae]|uniref:DUF3710 domain-containing protein n=1 Tax=Phaeacidiphilus oryzae TaxID=348818 RepID=UPI000562F24C|nr:DUF3710 domain-containing protein [Phaeacidiphilus oryzae]
MFGRRRKSEDAADQQGQAEAGLEYAEDTGVEAADSEEDRVGLPPAPRPDGPWDLSEISEDGADPHEGRVDLGGLLVPMVQGMELRVEVAGDSIVAATLVVGSSAIQLQAFAAPKSEGIWSEVRAEIAAGITQQGGVVDEEEGPLGWSLRAQVPVQLPDGAHGVQVVRFIGCDGPRWFLRGVISGQAAVQPEAAGLLEQVFRETVVVRGEAPMAPRDPLVLKLPDDAQMVADGLPQQSATADGEESRFAGSASLNPFERGPEITEVR